MKQIVCEMCGGKELIKQDGVFVCQNCETKYSVEEAKKMMVKIDNSDKLENALKNARRARECKNSEQAEKYYDIVLTEDAENWEAIFYTTYFKAMQCRIAGISLAADSVSRCIKTVLKNIKKREDGIQQNEAIKQISTDLFTLSLILHNAAINNYNEIIAPFLNNPFFQNQEAQNKYEQECSGNVLSSAYILLIFGDELVSEFGENNFTNPIIIQCYETSLEQLYKAFEARYIKNEFLNQYIEKLRKLKPSYNFSKKSSENIFGIPEPKPSACYIATAVYGSYDCPQVLTLRHYRDNVLANTWYGRTFISLYYSVSPTIVRLFGKKNWFNAFFKKRLDVFIEKLKDVKAGSVNDLLTPNKGIHDE